MSGFVSPPGGTLDTAYNFGGPGAGRSVAAINNAVSFASTANDANNVLELSKSPVAPFAGSALSIFAGANATSPAVFVNHAGAGGGVAVTVADAATSPAISATCTTALSGGNLIQGNAALGVNGGSVFQAAMTRTAPLAPNTGAIGFAAQPVLDAADAVGSGVAAFLANGPSRNGNVGAGLVAYQMIGTPPTDVYDYALLGLLQTVRIGSSKLIAGVSAPVWISASDGVGAADPGEDVRVTAGAAGDNATAGGDVTLEVAVPGSGPALAAVQTISGATGSVRFDLVAGASLSIYDSTAVQAFGFDGTSHEMRFYGTTAGYSGFVAAATTTSVTYTLPTADGSAGQVLSTSGAGVLSWITVGGGGGVTLDGAYDFGGAGAGRTITADAGAVVITTPAANNNNVLELTKNPAGAQSGAGLFVTMGATTTGAGVSVSMTAGSSGAAGLFAGGNVVAQDATSTYASFDSATRALLLHGSTSGTTGFKAPATVTSVTYTLPTADGTAGQVLSTSGAGVLSWATASGGGGSLQAAYNFTPSGAITLSTAGGALAITNPGVGGVAGTAFTVTQGVAALAASFTGGSVSCPDAAASERFGASATATGLGGASAFGNGASAGGAFASAFGASATASADQSVALGTSTTATAVNSTAVGFSADATSLRAVAIGASAQAIADDTTALGQSAQATFAGAVALGSETTATQSNAISIGFSSDATGTRSVAIGSAALASAIDSIAIGASTANGSNAIAMGSTATASNSGTIAIGQSTTASGANGIAIGNGSTATATGAIALGAGADALHAPSVAIGPDAFTTAVNQVVVGSSTGLLNTIIFGSGVTSAVPATSTLQATSGTGGGSAGGGLRLATGVSGDAATGSSALRLAVAVAGTGTALTDVLYVDSAEGSVLIGTATPVAGKKLVVSGDVKITGVLDPTALELATGTNLYIDSTDGSTAAAAAAGHGRMVYNDTQKAWRVSVDSGAYSNVITSATITSTAFVQNGNAFAGLATLGTTDANALSLITSNTARARILSGGAVLIGATTQGASEGFRQANGTSLFDGGSLTVSNSSVGAAGGMGNGIDLVQDNATANVSVTNYGVSGVTFSPGFAGRAARGTLATPTAVQTDDLLVSFNGRGYGSTGFASGSRGRIGVHAAEAWTDAAQGTYIAFSTTATGTATNTQRVRINPNGSMAWQTGGTYSATAAELLGPTDTTFFISAGQTAATTGRALTLTGGAALAASNAAGGALSATAGVGDGTGTGGALALAAGAGGGTGTGGAASIIGGAGFATGGNATLQGGAAFTTPGAARVIGGAGASTAAGGVVTIQGGAGGGTSGDGGAVTVAGGTPTDGNGGSVTNAGSNGVGTNRAGGSNIHTAGNATGSAAAGSITGTAGQSVTGTAGAITWTAGAGGSTSGAGGIAALVGGAGTAGNSAGGVARLLAGAGQGSAAGGAAQVTGGAGGATGAGGNVTITAGAGGATSGAAGAVTVNGGVPVSGAGGSITLTPSNGVGGNNIGGTLSGVGGNAVGSGAAGSVTWTAGRSVTGTAGAATLTAGQGGSTSGAGGIAGLIGGAGAAGNAAGGVSRVVGGAGQGTAAGGAAQLTGGAGGATGAGGAITITAGAGGATSGAAGAVNILGGTPVNGDGSTISLTASSGVGTNRNGGSVALSAGSATGSGTAGSITFATTGVVRGSFASDGSFRLNGASSGFVGLRGAAAAGSTVYTLPSTDGTTGQMLTTNGTATLSWTSPVGGSLDQAYDFGGAGAGRTINADAGDVLILPSTTGGLSVANATAGGVYGGQQFGPGAIASGTNSMAIGHSSSATGASSGGMAVGVLAVASTASGANATAIGSESTATGNSTLAVGGSSTASGDSDTAVGVDSQLTAGFGVGVGYQATISAASGVAIGYQAVVSHAGSIALGRGASSAAAGQFAVGALGLAISTVRLGHGGTTTGTGPSVEISPTPTTTNSGGGVLTISGGGADDGGGGGAGGNLVLKSGTGGSSHGVISLAIGGTTIAQITTAGSFVLQANGALATSATDGFTYLPTTAGTPTGTPTSVTGAAPIVYDTTNSRLFGYNGGWVNVAQTPVFVKTGNYTVLSTDSPSTFTNEGAAGQVILTLPTAVAGLTITAYVQAAQNLRVKATGSGTVRVGATVSGAAGYAEASTVGNALTLRAINSTEWVAISSVGTWTVV